MNKKNTENVFNNKKHKKKKKSKKKIKELTGSLSVHKKGFGFFILDEEIKEELQWDKGDVFIKRNKMKDAMDGDRVAIILDYKNSVNKSLEGEVTRVLDRKHKSLVGTMQRNKKYGFVVPINKKIKDDIFVKGANLKGACEGDLVKVDIVSYQTKSKSPEGRVCEIVAKASEAGADIKAKIVESGRSLHFPKEVNDACKKISIKTLSEEAEHRVDLRGESIFTIDGKDSKDFDDAVGLKIEEDATYTLSVHIADVSFYVKENDVIDRQAFNRANSVYLINEVVPMLPEKLSNDICSLKENEDRLTLSCEMKFTEDGKMKSYDIFNSIIKSKARLTYDEVNEFLENKNEKALNVSDEIKQTLKNMEKLAKIFIDKRGKRGAIDFDSKEPKIILDKKGRAKDVLINERGIAHRLIEEFMLKANECVARHIFWMKLPFIYRNHSKPTVEKISEVRKFLSGMGIHIKGDITDIKPFQIRNVIEESKSSKVSDIVQRAVLKSMEKAEYDVQANGHFGLALDTYCHFTSPIRRYPDLVVHRVLKAVISGNIAHLSEKKFEEECKKISHHCSEVERETMVLERDVEKMKLAEFLSKHIGKKFEGVVSGITRYGIYVEILGCIDGRVAIDELGDEVFVAYEEEFKIVGITSKKTYRLGDEVEIIIENVDLENVEIDFLLT